MLFFRYLHFPTFLLVNVIIDIEPFLVMFLDLDYPLHGFLHTFIGGTIVAFPFALIMNKIKGSLTPILKLFRVEQELSFKNVLIAALFGIYIHILLDSRMHFDIRPFFPIDFNPFLSGNMFVGFELYTLSIWMFIGGMIIYFIRLFLLLRKKSNL
jgi:membrane-bound metal-dependent hydrolase YbcI (DUF457 family)